MSVKEIRHVGFSVKNEEKALDFYCRLLGFKVIKKAKEDENFANKVLKTRNINYVKLIKGKQEIELYIMPRDYERGRWNHIALGVKNITELYTTLSEAGIRFISEPTIDPIGRHKLCFCQDPDGNLVELVEELAEKDRPNITISKRQEQQKIEQRQSSQPSPSLSQRIKIKRPATKEISEEELDKEYKEKGE